MKNWYIRNNDEHLGPYSLEELKMVGLYSDDYVWKEGLPKWTKAEMIAELKESIIAVENYLFTPEPTAETNNNENDIKQKHDLNGFDVSKMIDTARTSIASMFKKMLY